MPKRRISEQSCNTAVHPQTGESLPVNTEGTGLQKVLRALPWHDWLIVQWKLNFEARSLKCRVGASGQSSLLRNECLLTFPPVASRSSLRPAWKARRGLPAARGASPGIPAPKGTSRGSICRGTRSGMPAASRQTRRQRSRQA